MDTFGEVCRKERRAKAWTLERAGKRVGLDCLCEIYYTSMRRCDNERGVERHPWV